VKDGASTAFPTNPPPPPAQPHKPVIKLPAAAVVVVSRGVTTVAHPAELILAVLARHVVAATILLDVGSAARTPLGVLGQPLLRLQPHENCSTKPEVEQQWDTQSSERCRAREG
jgi:hypothetical protein